MVVQGIGYGSKGVEQSIADYGKVGDDRIKQRTGEVLGIGKGKVTGSRHA